MESKFFIEEAVSFLVEALTTRGIEKRKIEKAKEKLSDQITDFFYVNFVEKYEGEIWFSKCFDLMYRDKYLSQIFSHFFELNRPISIESLCSTFTNNLLSEYPDYSTNQKQIFDSIKWFTYEIIRILRNSEEIPKEYISHFDSYDMGHRTTELQLDTLSGVRQILDFVNSFSNKSTSGNSLKELYAINKKNISFFQKQYEILDWVSKGNCVKEAMVSLAFLERDEGDFDRAIEIFKYVADNYSEEVDLYNNVGCMYLDIGEYKKANKYFYNVAFSDNGNKCYAYYNLALWEYEVANMNVCPPPAQGKYYYSINMINHALSFLPDDIDSMNFKAFLFMLSKQNMEEAYSLFCKCIEKEDRYEYRVNLSIFYLLNRDFEKAEVEVKKLLQNNDDSFLYGLLGNIYGTYGMNKIEDAIKMLNKAYEISCDENYLLTAQELMHGGHIDSVFLNGTVIEIYTDHEVIEFNRAMH